MEALKAKKFLSLLCLALLYCCDQRMPESPNYPDTVDGKWQARVRVEGEILCFLLDLNQQGGDETVIYGSGRVYFYQWHSALNVTGRTAFPVAAMIFRADSDTMRWYGEFEKVNSLTYNHCKLVGQVTIPSLGFVDKPLTFERIKSFPSRRSAEVSFTDLLHRLREKEPISDEEILILMQRYYM